MKTKFSEHDAVYLSRRREVAADIGRPDLYDVIDQFGLYAGAQTLVRSHAVCDLLRQTLETPGDIVEFGCWKGANLLTMAKFLSVMQPNTIKQMYAFDSFEGLQTFDEKDGAKAEQETRGDYVGDEAVIRKMIALHGFEEWVHLVVGNAIETIPEFFRQNDHKMISFAYVDFDLYEPCAVALEHVDRCLSVNGLIVFDEALTDQWPGEGIAARELLDKSTNTYETIIVPYVRQPTLVLRRLA